MESFVIVVFLGIVEGLTEFIPVSSTGHLIVAGNLLGFVGEKAATFEVAIQLGAVLSVVVLYRDRFLRLLPRERPQSLVLGSTLDGLDGVLRIAAATLPALVAGYLGHSIIKSRLFNPAAVSAALAAGGVGLLFVERHIRNRRSASLDSITLGQALGIGLFQILALWPGTSRAAATIAGGMLLGLERKAAAEFSFLIAVPVMAAATGYDLLKTAHALGAADIAQLAVGFAVSFVVALATVKTFIRLLNRWSLVPFAYYRIAAAPIFYLLTRGRLL